MDAPTLSDIQNLSRPLSIQISDLSGLWLYKLGGRPAAQALNAVRPQVYTLRATKLCRASRSVGEASRSAVHLVHLSE